MMSYEDRLKIWVILKQLASGRWVVIARFRNRSDADGHLAFLQRSVPEVEFIVMFLNPHALNHQHQSFNSPIVAQDTDAPVDPV